MAAAVGSLMILMTLRPEIMRMFSDLKKRGRDGGRGKEREREMMIMTVLDAG